MAKTTRFTGATSGALSVAGNWDNGVPVTGDTAIVDNATRSVTSGLAAVALASLHVTSRYTGNWGASGSAIDGVGATMLVWESSGAEAWIGSASIVRGIIHPRSTQANAIQFVGTGLGQMRFVSGRITLDAACTLGSFMAMEAAGDPVFIGPDVTIPAGITWGNSERLIVNTGRALLSSGPNGINNGLIEVNGGEVHILDGTVDSLFVNGGICRHIGGTVSEAFLTNGIWDSSEGADDRTLTTFYQAGGESTFVSSAGVGKPGTFIYLGGKTNLPPESYTL